MKTGTIVGSVIGGFLGLTALFSSVYTINEKQQAVVTAQGNPVAVYVGSLEAGKCDPNRIQLVKNWADQNGYGNVDVECYKGFLNSGLHFKIPFWENVVKLPDQIVEYNSSPETVQTKDKRQLIVDNYTKFYIENPLSFYLKVGDNVNYGIRKLDDIVYSIVRDNVAEQNFNENIRTTDRQVMALDGPENLGNVEYGREKILSDIIGQSHDAVQNLGMSLVDVRFISVELPQQNEQAVFDRMISERNRIAALYKAEGDSQYTAITSNADFQAAQTRADAQQKAGETVGEGESQAAQIYTAASKQDPEFFSFWRTLKAYQQAYCQPVANTDPNTPSTCTGKTELIMTTDSAFNQDLFGTQPK